MTSFTRPSIIFEAIHVDAIGRQLLGPFDEPLSNIGAITERFQSLCILEVDKDRLYNMPSSDANPDEHLT